MPELSERNFCDGLEIKFTSPLGEIQQVGLKQQRKALLLVLLSVSDHKRLDTSSYFIIIRFHTELKPQLSISHDMNSPTFTLYTQPLALEVEEKKGPVGPSLYFEI